jgi:hypothetical protein
MLLKEVFIFFAQKSHFYFLVPQMDVFVKDLLKFNLTIGSKQSPKILDHSGFKIQHLVEQ